MNINEEILSFDEAMEKANTLKGNIHLLLGNGFSMAFDPNIFGYNKLFEKASSNFSLKTIDLFIKLKKYDFEHIIRDLNNTKKISTILGDYPQLIQECNDIEEEIRGGLIAALTSLHIHDFSKVNPNKLDNCINFLQNFNEVFTLNYDLLLYWVIMHWNNLKKNQNISIPHDDGFRGSDGVLVLSDNDKNVHYLHGAFHIFNRQKDDIPERRDRAGKVIDPAIIKNSASYIEKINYTATGTPLLDLLKTEIQKSRIPLLVIEGLSEQKKSAITNNEYLLSCYNSLEDIESCFVYGHSFSVNDNHIYNKIKAPKNFFISLYKDNEATKQRAKTYFQSLNQKKTRNLQVYFYDAESAKVWG